MFFLDPVAAFADIGRALRPAGRLVMMVWQGHEQNEWSLAIEEAVGNPRDALASEALDPFSLADPAKAERILDAAGFTDVTFTDVQRPIHYGRNVAAALEWIRGFTCTREALAERGTASADRALGRLREALVAHASGSGVWFDSCAWIVKAHRR
jgi:SAM-dependent methyltransferase